VSKTERRFTFGMAAHLAVRAALLSAALFATHSTAAQIFIDADTFLKTSTGQASSLPASSKCAFTKGQSFEITSVSDGGASHWRVVLPRAYTGCALTSGFIYMPHVTTESLALSVKSTTVFKKTTGQASTLPASSKCDIAPGMYSSSAAITTELNHFKINMKTLMPNCAFSLGYVYIDFASAGILQLSTANSVFLTTTAADPATVPAANKCQLAKGNYALTAQPSYAGGYYSVAMANNPAGCAFKTGFVAYEQTYLAGPAFNPANYTAPLANGIAGDGDQAWCVCRNVGTSPHIGQDWNANGAENSVAIATGTIVDKTFSSTCGHTLTVRDPGGTDFLYRHLNSNTIQIGDAVTKGQFLGGHSVYPTSSCGTGPHLHFERRSAGVFRDSEVVKTCQFGPSSCNYNPNSPFQAPALKSAQRGVEDMTVTGVLGNKSVCRVEPARYGKVEVATLAQYAPASSSATRASALSLAGGVAAREGRTVLNVAVAAGNNVDNVCGAGEGCLTSWSVVVETRRGEWVRVFHDGTIRNRAVALLAEEAHCLPADATGRAMILTTDERGVKSRQEMWF
jgi:murein DD-endopeptidase MepM/ murein hydrolase activator NlpD